MFATSDLMRRSALAGVLISIGAMFSIAVAGYGNAVQGACFSVGLFGVLCMGASLFTGRMLDLIDVLDGRACAADTLCRQWPSTWSCNFLGAIAVGTLAYLCGFDSSSQAVAKASMPLAEMFARAILCNVCVCGAVWCFKNRSDHGAVDALACSLPFVACFVACGFEHCVADMLYMFLGFLREAVSFTDCARVLLVSTVGNMVGGMLVALAMRGGR